MKTLKNIMKEKNKILRKEVRKYSSLSPSVNDLTRQQKNLNNYAVKSARLDVKCDLNLKQCIDAYIPPVSCASRYREKIYINEHLASANLLQFSNRLNYRCYKNAFRRYGKRLDMISCIEGGKKDLRMGNVNEDKRLHCHVSIQKPDHIQYDQFVAIILQEWLATEWGYGENKITIFDRKKDFEKYQTKEGMDSLLPERTFIGASVF